MTALDITDIKMIGTSDYEAACAIAAVECELDGSMEAAEQIRADYREAKMLHEAGLL